MYSACATNMKNRRINMRLSERRMNKLLEYAVHKDKTITQVVEELIDSLPETKELPIK
jgi:hypothetical protein